MESRSLTHSSKRILGILFLFLVFPWIAVSCRKNNADPNSQNPTIKIFISGSGIYRIEAGQLNKLGWDIADINPDQVVLLNKGIAVPFWIEGSGNDLELQFYGEEVNSNYTNENVYFLILESEIAQYLQLEDQSPSAGVISDTQSDSNSYDNIDPLSNDVYIRTLELEENNHYSPQAPEGDSFYWFSLTAPQKEEIPVNIDHLVEGDGQLIIEVWGSTEAQVSPDHHLLVSVNGMNIADEWWDGMGRHTIVGSLPAGVLVEGENLIVLESPGDTGVVVDIVNLDWIRIDYPREMYAIGDRLEFVSNGSNHHFSGFSGELMVFDITDPTNVVKLPDLDERQKNLAIQLEAEHRYFVVGEEGYLSPANMERILDYEIDIKNITGADYIAIGPPDLLEPLKPLLDIRQDQGLSVIAVPIETIYDYFNYGLPEPEAIRSFLRYAVTQWENPPQYVLLVGDATFDPRGFISPPGANQVPTFMIDTLYGGETASDILFVQLDQDQLPDLAIGRIPARESNQVRDYVDKVRGYEQTNASQEWRSRVLAVFDPQETIYESEARTFLGRFPDPYVTSLYPEEFDTGFSSGELVQKINEGNLLISYFGHGSVDVWGKDQIFSTEDVKDLSNIDRLPVFMTMTCLNGLFTHPEKESLAETLIWHDEGGAITVLAPTSLTQTLDQRFLNQAFVDTFLSKPDFTIGDILLESQRQIPVDNPGAYEVMLTFLLFGDPALQIPRP